MASGRVPSGYHTVTPYLVITGVDRLLAFLKAAFDAEEILRVPRADGSVLHAEARIGDSRIMMADTTGPAAAFGPMPAAIYLYVNDCDASYARALAAGATAVAPVKDIPFNGERYGAVRDLSGNLWWIATHVSDVTPEEMLQRLSQA